MTALNMTSFDAALKEHYKDDVVRRMTYQDNPFHAMLPKMTDFGGKNLPIPIIYGNPQGRSATFTTAQTNKVAGKYTDFVITRSKDYGLCSIDGETIDASKGDKNAFLDAMATEIDGTFESVTRSLATSEYRNGSGAIGQIGSASTVYITLADTEEVTNFEVGMKLVASTAAGGGSVKQTASVDNTLTVAGVDRDAGILTMSAAYDSFGSNDWAANDYLFVQGDYDSKIKGLDAWIPATMPTSGDSFFGVDRSVDTRLAGLRKDISSMPLEEGLIDGAKRVHREGGNPSHCFMSYNRYGILEKSLGSKVQYVDLMTDVGVGFRGIKINTNKGMITVLADQNCPDNTAWMLQMNVWKLCSLGEAPKLLMHDGNRVLREAAEDGVEVRTGYYAQLACRAPGWNIRLTLA
jgi:hypothetical protein